MNNETLILQLRVIGSRLDVQAQSLRIILEKIEELSEKQTGLNKPETQVELPLD